jgi:hypothetical protein
VKKGKKDGKKEAATSKRGRSARSASPAGDDVGEAEDDGGGDGAGDNTKENDKTAEEPDVLLPSGFGEHKSLKCVVVVWRVLSWRALCVSGIVRVRRAASLVIFRVPGCCIAAVHPAVA